MGEQIRTSLVRIPLVDLQAQHRVLCQQIHEAVARVLDGGRFILGEEVLAFEREFAEACEARYAVGTASGTAALHLAFASYGIGPGDEVITTPLTFIATWEAIACTGARAIFVDVDPETLTIDPAKLETAITSRTRAIVPVHLYGFPAAMEAILPVARRYGLRVIEDAAQAHGARSGGRAVGSMGDAGCFSFYPAKNLGACGDAGALVTHDGAIADRARRLRDHGRADKYVHLERGYGYRLDELQAAILRVKLGHLAAWNARRRELAKHYRRVLEGLPINLLPNKDEGVYHLFVIRSEARDALREHLWQQGIEAGIHYPLPLHLQPACAHLGYGRGDFPVAERAATEVLSLPLYPEMSPSMVEAVATAIQDFFDP